MTIPGCMKEWKNLRDHFVREIRKPRTKPSGGQVHLMNQGGLILRP